MHIDHIALYVNNLEQAKDFFITYFSAEANGGYHNPNTGFRSYFLTFSGGCRLELMQRPNMDNAEKTPVRTGYIHLAFSVGSKEAVDVLTDRLRRGGYKTVSGPRTTGDNYYESCVAGIEDNLIEITI